MTSQPNPRNNWVPGCPSPNPQGRGSIAARLSHRFEQWLEHKTAGEIEALVNDTEKWNKLPSIDAMLARRISAALSAKDSTKDFMAIMEYYVGKPKRDDDALSLAAAVASGAVQGLVTALADKLLTVHTTKSDEVEQSVKTPLTIGNAR